MRGRLNAICGDGMDEMDGMGGDWLSLVIGIIKPPVVLKKKGGSKDLVANANCTF